MTNFFLRSDLPVTQSSFAMTYEREILSHTSGNADKRRRRESWIGEGEKVANVGGNGFREFRSLQAGAHSSQASPQVVYS
jgi:hypothetical protein